MGIDKELLDILACPKCKTVVHLNDKKDGLVCCLLANVPDQGRHSSDAD